MTTYLDEHARDAADQIGHGAEVSITFRHHGAPVRGGSSSMRAARCDQIEVRMDEGPCIDAMVDLQTVLVPSVEDDPRWPAWSSRTAAEGFVACFAQPAPVAPGTSLAINVYLPGPWQWDSSAEPAVERRTWSIADEMRVRLAASRDEHAPAPHPDDLVQQAVGVLMHSNGIGVRDATLLLERAAAISGAPVVGVARSVLAASAPVPDRP